MVGLKAAHREFPKHTVRVAKGLTREQAMTAAPWRKSYGDCRGFSYNTKTGEATWT